MNLAFGFNILILTGVEASILAKKNQKNCVTGQSVVLNNFIPVWHFF